MTTTRQALIVGSTGLVGSHCLRALYQDPNYSKIIVLTRKPTIEKNRKLHEVISNFKNLEQDIAPLQADDIFCCLGTTIKKAGTQESFRQVDHDLVVIIAGLMRKKGAEQFIVISAMGANSHSKIFYNRVKGEMEESVTKVGYPSLRIIRPSLLLGDRKEFRFAERMGIMLNPLFKLFLLGSLKKYRPVKAEKVGRFMVKVAHERPLSGVHVYESNMII